MKVAASSVPGVRLHGPDSPEFETALTAILGRAPRQLLRPALPFSVIVENNSSRTIALLGVRFDMLGARAKEYSVVHYADTLRNPEKADLRPGVTRFVCAEPAYTALVIRGEVAADTRGRMNLDNLRRMLQIRASLDCVAFADGSFHGPDSQGAFDRLSEERRAEAALLAEMLGLEAAPPAHVETLLTEAVQDASSRGRRNVARTLLEGLAAGGMRDMLARARSYRCRIALTREVAG